jgi:esterase/lipase superfamily enzyme
MKVEIFYGTNRRHQGDDRWHPTGYGTDFSSDGSENLRFGKVSFDVDDQMVQARLAEVVPDLGAGNGEDLSTELSGLAASAVIVAFPEALDANVPESAQPQSQVGSAALFAELKARMDKGADVLVYIHGFNTSWASAVGAAAALQIMLNGWSQRTVPPAKEIVVVLFSWPSDGLALPWTSYRSDRTDAEASGNAIGRGFLKFRDFLADLHLQVRQDKATACGSKVHLLCHSMGNYVLQNALARLASFSPGSTMPRILDGAFLCAADVDDDALEPGEPLGRLDEVCDKVSIYFNHNDRALAISDWTKGNPDRLGARGPAHRSQLHGKVETIDCTSTVQGAIQHSYYLNGACNRDIWMSIMNVDPYDRDGKRQIMPDGGFLLKKA